MVLIGNVSRSSDDLNGIDIHSAAVIQRVGALGRSDENTGQRQDNGDDVFLHDVVLLILCI